MTAAPRRRPVCRAPFRDRAHPHLFGNEWGQVGGIEAITFGIAIFVAGVLMVSNAWGVVDAKTAARTAAREAARTFATALETSTASADVDAVRAGGDTLHEMGWTGAANRVIRTQGTFARCAVVTYEAIVEVPAFRLPWLRSGLTSFRVTAYDSQRVDAYRSAVPSAPTAGAPTVCGGGDVTP